MKNKKLLLGLLFFAVMGMMADMTMAKSSISIEEEGTTTGWTTVGPNNISGRVRAAMFDKYNYGVVYAGTVGGLYISVNNGKNWEELNLGSEVQNVTALTQDENGIVYVGTGEGFYRVGLHNLDALGKSDAVSGRVGTGVYKLANANYTREWAANFATDEEKYAWAKENITFEHMTSTTVQSRYDSFDEWAYINAMAYANGYLYVGTQNAGLKVSQNGQDSFTSVQLEGNSALAIHDIAVNPNGVVAVAYDNAGGAVAVNTVENPTTFAKVFNSDVTTAINQDDAYLGRVKVTFGQNNPDYLYAFVATPSQSFVSASEYTQYDINGYAMGIYRTKSLSDVSWNKITPGTFSTGNQLGYAMGITVNDADSNEIVYAFADAVYSGQDVNGTDVFSWSALTSQYATDTSGMFVPANIHNLLFMPNANDMYDSIFMLATTDAGVFSYKYDTIIRTAIWFPSKGMNTLQAYKVAATPNGAVLAASQSNAIVLMPSTSATELKGGMKMWSVNNPGYAVTSEYDYYPTSSTGSAVEASAIYRTLPTNKIRRPVIVARPFTNLARTYGNNGDFESIDDQTWTYGSGSQALLSAYTLESRGYSQFITPIDFWETFNASTNTLDSVKVKLNDYTYVVRNGHEVKTIAGQEIKLGDTLVVESDNLSYPFFYEFTEADRDVENFPTGDALFMRWNEAEDTIITVPQQIQSKTLLATESGVFVCGKMLDFSRTYTSGNNVKNNLTWARIYNIKNYATNFKRRIRNVAFSQDGASAFISVDCFGDYNRYDSTFIVRVDGLDDVDISDGSSAGFSGSATEVENFTATTIATFNRPVSSIVINPNDANKVVLTFDNYSNGDNLVYSENAMDANVTFSAVNAPDPIDGSFAPVFTGLFEAFEGTALYVGTDNGIYKSTNYASGNATWTKEENVPSIPVYDIWQQTKNLPVFNNTTYTSTSTEQTRFEATHNAGVIYAATYGKGILMNSDYKQENPDTVYVGLNDVANSQVLTTLNVYPNPATTETVVSYTLNQPSTVTFNMFDVNGRLVSVQNNGRESKGAHSQLLDIRNLQNGVYMIQMVTESETRTAKLIVK